MTSSIARMNLFLHGIEDFDIARGDTLADPAFLDGDRLRTLRRRAGQPAVLDQAVEPRRRGQPTRGAATSCGTPPQGRADYAFFQHILASLDPKTGRCADPVPARRAVPRRGARDAREAGRGRPASSACSGSGRTCSTTRRWRRASSSADRKKPPSAQGQGAVHQRGQRGHPRAGAELPAARAPAAHPRRLHGVSRTSPASPRSPPLDEIAAQGQPVDPAVREAQRRSRRRRQRWRRGR